MKKILCLIDGLESGGAQRQIVGLAGFLKRRGYEVDLAYYTTTCFYNSDISRYNVNLITLKPKDNKISKMYAVSKMIRMGKYDVVIAYILGPGVISCLTKMLFHQKYKLIVSERNNTPIPTLLQRIKFAIYSLSDYVVSNSYVQTSMIQSKFRFLKNKSLTIQNFVDTDNFLPKWHKPGNVLRILVVGRILEVKNVKRFIEGIHKAILSGVNLKVEWYGNINNHSYYNECLTIISTLHIDNLFHFHPAKESILEEYQNSDLFCLPSLSEGCPNVICEAMSCGLPVVCSNVCDNPMIVEEGVTGFLFDPNNSTLISESIQKFAKLSEEERLAMGRACRIAAESKFSISSFTDKYIELIEG